MIRTNQTHKNYIGTKPVIAELCVLPTSILSKKNFVGVVGGSIVYIFFWVCCKEVWWGPKNIGGFGTVGVGFGDKGIFGYRTKTKTKRG